MDTPDGTPVGHSDGGAPIWPGLLFLIMGLGTPASASSGPWVPMDFEAVGVDVLTGICLELSCRTPDQAVLRSSALTGGLGLLLDGRIVRSGEAGQVSLGGAWAHHAPQLLIQLGGECRAVLETHNRVAVGPWVSLTRLSPSPSPRPSGLLEDLRNRELTAELRGGFSRGQPGPQVDGRIEWTMGSPELRAGAVVESRWIPTQSGTTDPVPSFWGGMRVEMRPTPRSQSPHLSQPQ